ncbi:MAG TPA: acetylxylan esterase [Anaerolineales bacterium]|nr:acetylxylan esterase [Anaerolineales bacterium]
MPLTFDLPFDELLQYNGLNPKPADFDQYWEAGLREMRSIDPQISLVRADFQTVYCDCFHLTFTGVNGARVHSKLLKPKSGGEKHPAILMFHGYTVSSGDWTDKLGYVAQGYTVAAMDCRGQAGGSEDVGGVTGNTMNGQIIRGLADALKGYPEKLLFRQIFLDTAQLAKIVMEMDDVDESRVGVCGGSQGGALTIACAALEPRVKKIAPMFPFLSDYKRIWTMDRAVEAYAEIREFFRMFDPRHIEEEKIFENLGYIDIQHLAPRVRAEVLWGIGLMDDICPPSTQFAVYNKVESKKSMAIYPDFGHESLPGFADKEFQFFSDL